MLEDTALVSELELLSGRICSNANKLSCFLQLNGDLHRPSGVSTSMKVLPSTAPESVHLMRQNLKQDALKLFRLASGPEEYISHLSLNHQYTICLRYLIFYDIFSNVPDTNSISLSNLSIITSAPLSQLTSVVCMAMTSGLFVSTAPSRISHSETSRLLASSSEFKAWATCTSQYMFQASEQFQNANQRWGRSLEPQHTAFNLAFDTGLSFPEYLAQNPTMAKNFGNFVKATQTIDANDCRHFINGYDWQSLGSTTVVDIECSSAYPSVILANRFPSLVFELRAAARSAEDIKEQLCAVDAAIAQRFTLSTHSMFAPPAADTKSIKHTKRLYLLRHILHNLPNRTVLSILSNLVTILKPDDTILIVDLVLPGLGDWDPYDEGMIRMRDLIQTQLANNGLRDADEWKRLVSIAGDQQAMLVRISRPLGSDMSSLEIRTKKSQD